MKKMKIKFVYVNQGTDITEAFESHHITTKAKEMLNNFYVCEASDPRNYFLTYKENGFYQTLKRRIAIKLETVDTTVKSKSQNFHDLNLLFLFFATAMVNRSEGFAYVIWTILAGQSLAWSANFSHNFMHQADNWRMYTASISLITFRDYRVSHVLVSQKKNS
jgi:hypothetical protein